MRFFDVKKSTFYDAEKSEPIRQAKEAQAISMALAIRQVHPKYGTVKLKVTMERQGFGIGRQHLNRLLAERGMLQPKRNRRKVHASIPGLCAREYTNLVKDLEVTDINQVICTDITYIHTTQGVIYLYAIIDMHSRKILSHHVSSNLMADNALKCLKKALKGIGSTEGIIHHSDRGCQYTSISYLSYLLERGMRPSFTGRDHCYDNAIMERVFNTLKNEYGLKSVIVSKKVAIDLIDSAVDIYNNDRLHEALGYKTPSEVYDNQTTNQPSPRSSK